MSFERVPSSKDGPRLLTLMENPVNPHREVQVPCIVFHSQHLALVRFSRVREGNDAMWGSLWDFFREGGWPNFSKFLVVSVVL